MKRFGKVLNKKGYVKKTQSMRSRNKVVDGEPVAEQKTSLISNRSIPKARVRKEKERLTAVKKLHTLLKIWNRWIYFGSGAFEIKLGSWKTESLLSAR